MNNIYFDMDGTLCDLYSCPHWLEDLKNEKTDPYENAKPLVNFSSLARRLNNLQRRGYTLNIISCTAKNGRHKYNEKVEEVKRQYLKKHLKSVHWNNIYIIPYNQSKNTCGKGILFDDEERHRSIWNGKAYTEKDIMEVLKRL